VFRLRFHSNLLLRVPPFEEAVELRAQGTHPEHPFLDDLVGDSRRTRLAVKEISRFSFFEPQDVIGLPLQVLEERPQGGGREGFEGELQRDLLVLGNAQGPEGLDLQDARLPVEVEILRVTGFSLTDL
jgi:hypothetical protein